jgi:hypothetical protein
MSSGHIWQLRLQRNVSSTVMELGANALPSVKVWDPVLEHVEVRPLDPHLSELFLHVLRHDLHHSLALL